MRRAVMVLLVLAATDCRRTAPATLGDAGATPPSEAPEEASAAPARAGAPPHLDGATGPTLPDVRTDWCLEGWRGLDEGTCYYLPARYAPRLLVYLPGILPPTPRSPQHEKVFKIIAAAAERANVVALVPRGVQGIGPAGAKDWWAWPTSPDDYAKHGAGIVAAMLASKAKLESALRPFELTFLAGSSSGAYFVSGLAIGGAVSMDGYAAISGGAPNLTVAPRDVKRVPFYIGYASGDPTKADPRSLRDFLEARGWSVRSEEHLGGHGAREEYLDEAFAHWSTMCRQ